MATNQVSRGETIRFHIGPVTAAMLDECRLNTAALTQTTALTRTEYAAAALTRALTERTPDRAHIIPTGYRGHRQ